MSSKKWSISFLSLFLTMLMTLGAVTIIIDPFFHYHGPLKGLQYLLNDERHQNDGIAKHFSYDAIITGTSMTQNFKASEFNQLFSCSSIKISLSGASLKEIGDQISRAVDANPNISYILLSLDGTGILADKDAMRHDMGEFPTYLYDNNLFNDVNYVFNKEVLLIRCKWVLDRTMAGEKTTSFDDYKNWMSENLAFGAEAVAATYQRPTEKINEQSDFTETHRIKIEQNLRQNIISLVEKNPQIEFYIFIPPYSIYYWDSKLREGQLEIVLGTRQFAIELLTSYDNIHLFSFDDDFNLVCDLNNYKDVHHYHEDVNSMILHCMRENRHRLTKDNYQIYCDTVREFYTTYDYDALFSES